MDSKLQIISGVYRGRKLKLPPMARPTQNRARIALFNMLESGILDNGAQLKVWDAFAGSGAFGLECLSRYANATVAFTDVAPSSIRVVRDNLAMLGVGARGTVVQADAMSRITQLGTESDLIFLDPPYADADLGRAFVAKLGCVVKAGAILIWEQEVGNETNADERIWRVLRDKTYGRARFLILQRFE